MSKDTAELIAELLRANPDVDQELLARALVESQEIDPDRIPMIDFSITVPYATEANRPPSRQN